VNLSEVGPSAE